MIFSFILFASALFKPLPDLKPGIKQWVTLPLADSPEYKICGGKGALHLQQYKKLFTKAGICVHRLEIERTLLVFDDEEALKTWVRKTLPCNPDVYYLLMPKNGWPDFHDGKIRIPQKKLRALLSTQKKLIK